MTSSMQQLNHKSTQERMPAASLAAKDDEGWTTVCRAEDLVSDAGICVLVEEQGQQRQVAVFHLSSGALYAISNLDPIGGAAVLSRGITGSIGERVVVASPLYKHHFCLQTGHCLEDAAVCIPVWPVRRSGDCIQLQLA